MITTENIKRTLSKVINSCRKKLKRPAWLIGFPKDGNPLILSVWELSLYVACFVFFFWVFVQFNHIPHHAIDIEVNKLNAYRYVDIQSATNDSLYYLHFHRAELNLTFPLTFEHETNQEINLSGTIIPDSIQLKCSQFCVDPWISTSTLLKNQTSISTYWNIVFERAIRDGLDNIRPAPNYSVNDYYYELRDKYNQANSYKALKAIDSCYAQSKDVIRIDDNYKSLNSYQIKTVAYSKSTHKACDWMLRPLRTLTLEINKGEYITACEQGAQRYSSTDTSQVNELYFRESFSLGFSRHRRKIEKRYFDRDTIGMVFENIRAFPKDINYGHGWFELYDISQGYYDIKLKSATIDSLLFKIDFIGAVSYWPSIEPDEKSGTFIKYSNAEKILDIKNNGLKLFFESKELANKQSIRLFAVTAILSGLLIILITFIILVSARCVKSRREVNASA